MRELTKAEEQIMRILWKIKEGVVKDIVNQMPEPKPAYNTVATVVKVLEGKGFVNHKAYGNTYVYYPLIGEDQYKDFAFEKVMNNYFGSSYRNLVSFLVDKNKLDVEELEELLTLAERLKKE